MSLWGATIGWWVIAGMLVAVELATGTFYLLMLATGAIAAALAGHAGLGFALQALVAAVVGGAAAGALYWRRRGRPGPLDSSANRDVNLDIGNRVQVAHWKLDGTARVLYRGANWQVRHVGNGLPVPGDYVVRAVDGQTLLVDR